MPLCTQADLEKFGQVDFTVEPDPAVALWIAAATGMAESYCDRRMEETAGAVQTLDGPYGTTIRLDGYPVTAVNQIVDDGLTLIPGDDYVWYADGRVVRLAGGSTRRFWTIRPQAIVVDYDYGWAPGDVPADLRKAVALIGLAIFRRGEEWANSPAGAVGGLKALTLDGIGSADFTGDGGGSGLIDPVVHLILDRYRRRI